MPPIFLNLSEVLYIHQDQINRYGGRLGIRDIKLLQSAISMPKMGTRNQFLHKDLFEMAAAYLFHLVRNHPFLDGNKRTGLACSLVFLELNGIEVQVSQDNLAEMVISVAKGDTDKNTISNFFRRHVKKENA